MEQNMPIVVKKFGKIIRVAYFMLRKGISKGKILADLNIMFKRGKITGKLEAIHKPMFHHHSSAADHRPVSFPTPLNEYEFSCSNTPAHRTFRLPFNVGKRKSSNLVAEAVEMLAGAAASPALPGFGPSPMVRRLRVTDSPFPLTEIDQEDNCHVDEAAEEFIAKFYNDLKRQDTTAY